MNKKIFMGLVLGFSFGSAMAQVSLSGEFRPRTEYSHGYGTLSDVNQEASLFTSQRTRLNVDYKTTGITTKLVLQDVRNWGSQRQLVTNEDFGVSIHEAWAEAGLGEFFALRLGRQELVYDNHRIFGNVGWAQQGRSHDLALLKYKGFVEAHVGVAYHESGNRINNLYLGPDAYKFMQFIWLHKTFGNLNTSFLVLNNGVPGNIKNDQGDVVSQEIHYSQTFGPYLEYTLKSFSLAGNFYYQTGNLVNGNSLSAYEYLIEAGWKINDKLSTGVSWEVLSGTNADINTSATSFNPLYGTNHKFNGHMDYFYVGNHIGSVGLKDLTARVGYAAGKVKLGCDLHGFWSDATLRNTQKLYLGTELDLTAGYRISKAVDMMVGYSHLFATDAMESLKGGTAAETHHWAWVMFTFKVPE